MDIDPKQNLYLATTVRNDTLGFNYAFRSDGGYNLFPISLPQSYTPVEGQRVMLIGYCAYSLNLNKGDSAFHVSQIEDVLTKQITDLTGTGPNARLEMGKDPITPVEIWKGGGYINITFQVKSTNTVTHTVNLVYDPEDQDNLEEGCIRLSLLHNSNGDSGPGDIMEGIVSFKLGDDLPKKYVIKALTLDNTEKEDILDL
jgi:hypothetical protein